MDSLTHIVLGAAVGTAVLGRKAGPRAALWGAVCATLPDLDVLIPHGNPVRDFTLHRAESHSLFWLTVASPAIAWLIASIERRGRAAFRDWLPLVWLALVTHPLLDAFTVYGTQLLLPFSDYPVGLGSIFIIDPLFTVPLIIGLVAALRLRRHDPGRAARWNAAGLVASTAYLGWTVAAQAHVEGVVNRTLAASPLAEGRMLVTPAPLNSLLWRVVVMEERGYREGHYSLLAGDGVVRLERHASDPQLLDGMRDDWIVRRLAWFTKGFYSVREAATDQRLAEGSASTVGQLLGIVQTASAAGAAQGDRGRPVVVSDLRMGETPWLVFSFVVAEKRGATVAAAPPRQVPMERVPPDAVGRLWRRLVGEPDSAAAPL
jgi:inner membrane protein